MGIHALKCFQIAQFRYTRRVAAEPKPSNKTSNKASNTKVGCPS
jgi:hypothetical protein